MRHALAHARLLGLVSALAVGLVLTTGGPAHAHPAVQTTGLTAEAASRGVEPGNTPMGWRNARLGGTANLPAQVRSNDAGASAGAAKLKPMTGVLGLDVASYQKKVDWVGLRAQNRVFVYVKATEGTTYRNPYFAAQYTGSFQAGFIRGAYHFANPAGASGKAQADYFVNNGGGWIADGKTLPGVLDIEYNPHGRTCYGLTKTAMVRWIADFVTQYRKRTTRDAVIYTNADWWSRCTGNSTRFNLTNPLWVARYGTSAPGTLPGKWPFYTFWQYSPSPVDQNRFSASYTRLQVLARGK